MVSRNMPCSPRWGCSCSQGKATDREKQVFAATFYGQANVAWCEAPIASVSGDQRHMKRASWIMDHSAKRWNCRGKWESDCMPCWEGGSLFNRGWESLKDLGSRVLWQMSHVPHQQARLTLGKQSHTDTSPASIQLDESTAFTGMRISRSLFCIPRQSRGLMLL